MSQNGRALVQELKNGNYAAVNEYQDMSDLDIKMVNHNARELFTQAIEGEDKHLLDALMQIPDIMVSSGSYCAMRHAVKRGASEMVELLVQAPGLRPNMPEPSGDNALILAITGKWSEKKALDMVKLILNIPGVKVNFRGDNKQTALHHSLTKRWYKIARLLMENGANPKIYDAAGGSPLEKAMMATDLPSDLFTQMLTFNSAVEVEDEIAAMEQELASENQAAQDSPGIQDIQLDAGQISQPATPTYDQPTTLQPQNTPDTPAYTQPEQPVTQSQSTYTPPTPKAQPQEQPMSVNTANGDPIPHNRETAKYDEDAFLRALDAVDMVQLEREVTLEKLFFSPEKGKPWLIHRPEVLSGFDHIFRILEMQETVPTQHQAASIDPITGDNLWMAAAKCGALKKVINQMGEAGHWPAEQDLLTPDLSGRTVLQLLEARGELDAVLNAVAWRKNPTMLVQLIGRLSKGKRQSLRELIMRTHIQMLNQA